MKTTTKIKGWHCPTVFFIIMLHHSLIFSIGQILLLSCLPYHFHFDSISNCIISCEQKVMQSWWSKQTNNNLSTIRWHSNYIRCREFFRLKRKQKTGKKINSGKIPVSERDPVISLILLVYGGLEFWQYQTVPPGGNLWYTAAGALSLVGDTHVTLMPSVLIVHIVRTHIWLFVVVFHPSRL